MFDANMPTDQVCLGRKRPVPSCPNPLFLQWLTELRDSAKEKGLKTQYVYQKVNDCVRFTFESWNANTRKQMH